MKIPLKEAVIVEGRYDKSRLASIFDCMIVETGGFDIFRDREKAAMIRALAKSCGVIIVTDSDTAGFRIRGHLKSLLAEGRVYQVYIPQIAGKERRKRAPSAQGLLGVEGMSRQVILEAFAKAGVLCREDAPPREKLTKADLFAWGLSGTAQSAQRRRQLLERLGLPDYVTANGLMDFLNASMGRAQARELVQELFGPLPQQ